MVVALILSGKGVVTFFKGVDDPDDGPVTFRYQLAMTLGIISSCLLWVGIGVVVFSA